LAAVQMFGQPSYEAGQVAGCCCDCDSNLNCCNPAGSAQMCVDTTSDPNNCGGCQNVCPTGALCCKSACADVTSDPNNCGQCGHVCSTGQCVNNMCVCPSSTNFMTDPNNCGMCGKVCSSGQSCFNGVCTGPIMGTGACVASANGAPAECVECLTASCPYNSTYCSSQGAGWSYATSCPPSPLGCCIESAMDAGATIPVLAECIYAPAFSSLVTQTESTCTMGGNTWQSAP
jgi:hypothetical protein